MGARSVGSVVVSLGSFSVGVKLYLSAKAEQVGFHMINPKTGNRVKQVLVDEEDFDDETKTVVKDAETISRTETLKGYEYAKGKHIHFTQEEVANMASKRDHLDIVEFIPLSEINPEHVEKTYYANPDKVQDKQYTTLWQSLQREKKAAVGVWASRGKDNLIVIRPHETKGLVFHQMYYDTEMRGFELKLKKKELTPLDLAMCKVAIDQLSKDKFDKSKYSDQFADEVAKAVETKLNGGEIGECAPATVGAANDMAEVLRKSLIGMGVPEDQIDAMVARALAEAGEKPAAETKGKAKGKKAG